MSAASALAAAEARLPVDMIEVRPGRTLAVHRRMNDRVNDTALFVHGSCASLVQWEAQMCHLQASHSIIACDMCGCGRSPKPRGQWDAYSTPALLHDIAELARRFGGAGRLVLFGHSAGAGFVLQLLASEAAGTSLPATHVSAVLISAIDAVPASLAIFRLPVCVLELLQPLLSASFTEAALHPDTRAARCDEHRELLLLCDAINASNPMHMCKSYYRQLRVASPAQLACVSAPVLLIAGEADGLAGRRISSIEHMLCSAEHVN